MNSIERFLAVERVRAEYGNVIADWYAAKLHVLAAGISATLSEAIEREMADQYRAIIPDRNALHRLAPGISGIFPFGACGAVDFMVGEYSEIIDYVYSLPDEVLDIPEDLRVVCKVGKHRVYGEKWTICTVPGIARFLGRKKYPYQQTMAYHISGNAVAFSVCLSGYVKEYLRSKKIKFQVRMFDNTEIIEPEKIIEKII